MAKKFNDITKGKYAERYLEFQERYYDNIIDYVLDHSTDNLTHQQHEVLESIQIPGSRVVIASGHGTGKSLLAAWVIDWHLRVFPFSKTLLTATNIDQARAVTWGYIDKVIRNVEKINPWMKGFFIKRVKTYYARPYQSEWLVIGKTASKDKPENLSGMHAYNYLVFADEASGIPDANLNVVEGALTEHRNRMFMASQPTRPVGNFAEAMTKLAKKELPDGQVVGLWDAFTLNAEESPLVSKDFIRTCLLKYGGHHSPDYQIKVLGKLPDNLAGYLIPAKWCQDCQYYEIVHKEDWGWVLTVDVAEGVSRDSSVKTLAKVSGHGPERQVEVVSCDEYLDLNEKEFARVIAAQYREMPALTIAVDADGSGRTVILELEELGIIPERIHWGLPPYSGADKMCYLNQRAFAHLKLREGIFEERFKGPVNSKFVEQASKLPYRLDEKGRYAMMPKIQMKSEGIKSPDISDTCCFFYLTDYIPCGTVGANSADDAFLKMAREVMEAE